MENDNEAKGQGNSVDFGARIFDSRLGRWLSVDPMEYLYPQISGYTFVQNAPLIMVDPSGKVIVPYVELRRNKCVYPDFTSNSNGEVFANHTLDLHNSNTSNIFQQVYDQLQNSSRVYKFQETLVTPSGSGDVVRNSLRGPDPYGNFEPGHKGDGSDPYIINLNYDPGKIEGYKRQSTIFEETFHAGQHDFYLDKGQSKTHLQLEVEAKVAKAFQGIPSGSSYEENFRTDPVVQAYINAVRNGEEINGNLQVSFESKVVDLAFQTHKEYKKHWAKGGTDFLRQNDPKEYKPTESLDYLRTLVHINEKEDPGVSAKPSGE